MDKLIHIIKGIIVELIIVFLFIFLINNYLGNVEKTMKADGVGYYDYLPSTFIHHDILRKNFTVEQDPSLYNRISKYDWYVNYKGFKVNKYACGTAVLESPFFFYTYLTTPLAGGGGDDSDGYQFPFQRTVFHAAIFYLFLSLLFLAGLLRLYQIKKWLIVFIQLLFVFSTGVLLYANDDAGFSHIYSMFAVTAFVYFTKAYFVTKRRKDFLFASLFLGLIVILRQLNVAIIFFVPFLAGSFSELKSGLIILKDIWALVFSLSIILGIFSIQSFFWYAQTGDFLVYSYQGEGFNFLKPEIANVLFSYRKGLFIYTPVLFISMFGLLHLLVKKQYYLFFTWLLFFSILTYLLASWHAWWYGCSFGLRPYIDFYVVFFILLGILLNNTNITLRIIILLASLATIPVNIIQTYQYKNFILDWISMDKNKYWTIFLKTENKFKGLVLKKTYNYDNYNRIAEFNIGSMKIGASTDTLVFKINTDTIKNFNSVSIIQVKLDNDIDDKKDSRVVLSIRDNASSNSYYWHSVPLIHFKENNFGEWQTGLYNFEFNPIPDSSNILIQLYVESLGSPNDLQNVGLYFLSRK